MGKRIIQRRRGKGSTTYQTRQYAYRISMHYPSMECEGTVLKFINIAGHTTPLAMIKHKKGIFFNVATDKMEQGQKVIVGKNAPVANGNILPLSNIPIGTKVCNIEIAAYNGGKMVRSSGLSATVVRNVPEGIILLMPSGKERVFDANARATIGITAGGGRTEKPMVKAGVKYHLMAARNKHYPRTSPIKRNAVNHPFGGGRGKNMGKSGIAPRWAPAGRKVGLIRPKKSGRGGKR